MFVHLISGKVINTQYIQMIVRVESLNTYQIHFTGDVNDVANITSEEYLQLMDFLTPYLLPRP